MAPLMVPFLHFSFRKVLQVMAHKVLLAISTLRRGPALPLGRRQEKEKEKTKTRARARTVYNL